jgi:Flp pilus assembly protein TadG
MICHAKGANGQALIEFAFIILVMTLLALGTVNFALAVHSNMLVVEAAQEGALYSSFNTYSSGQTTSAQQAATTAGLGASGIAATGTTFCTCTPGGSTVSCSSACGSDQPMMYVQMTTSYTFNSLFRFSTLPSSMAQQSVAVMPVQ